MPLSVAIIGAGPAGFYTAEALVDLLDDVRIDIIERLPTPYGLIRAGVAPDHQSTKRVARRFERTALRERVQYVGNVEIGRDVMVDELRALYDAVVLAIGSPGDRPLGLPGEELPGVYGSASFVGWYNGHPDFRDLNPDLATTSIAVVGNGNVALDVARVLVKTKAELAATDLPEYANKAIQVAHVTDVHLVGRRGPADAKFTNVELREMGELAEAAPVVDAAQLPAEGTTLADGRDGRVREKNLATLRAFAARPPAGKRRRVHFRFYARPVEIVGPDKVHGLRIEHTRIESGQAVGTGQFETIPCGLVVGAIGYRGLPIPGVPFDADAGRIPNDDGRIAPGLYAVGWAKRGPTGVIGSNKPDGETCAEQIRAAGQAGDRPGRAALHRLLDERGVRPVSFDDWRAIDEAEQAAAVDAAPRRKFVTLPEMLAVLGRGDGRSPPR